MAKTRSFQSLTFCLIVFGVIQSFDGVLADDKPKWVVKRETLVEKICNRVLSSYEKGPSGDMQRALNTFADVERQYYFEFYSPKPNESSLSQLEIKMTQEFDKIISIAQNYPQIALNYLHEVLSVAELGNYESTDKIALSFIKAIQSSNNLPSNTKDLIPYYLHSHLITSPTYLGVAYDSKTIASYPSGFRWITEKSYRYSNATAILAHLMGQIQITDSMVEHLIQSLASDVQLVRHASFVYLKSLAENTWREGSDEHRTGLLPKIDEKFFARLSEVLVNNIKLKHRTTYLDEFYSSMIFGFLYMNTQFAGNLDAGIMKDQRFISNLKASLDGAEEWNAEKLKSDSLEIAIPEPTLFEAKALRKYLDTLKD